MPLRQAVRAGQHRLRALADDNPIVNRPELVRKVPSVQGLTVEQLERLTLPYYFEYKIIIFNAKIIIFNPKFVILNTNQRAAA